MATTTSCIAALQTIELLKLLGQKNKAYLNTFMNLAIPLFALSEPGDCQKVSEAIWLEENRRQRILAVDKIPFDSE